MDLSAALAVYDRVALNLDKLDDKDKPSSDDDDAPPDKPKKPKKS